MAISETQRHPYPATREVATSTPVRRSFQLLHIALIALPVIAGLDKFAMLLVDWNQYLAPVFVSWMPFDPHYFMYGVGVVEVLAGLVVAIRPRIGGYMVAAWLSAVVINLAIAGYWDIALRDVGLVAAAVALAWMASSPHARGPSSEATPPAHAR